VNANPIKTRMEHDSMGTLAVPAAALYGAQTQRAVDNFPVSGQRMPVAFIRALLLVKHAAALANLRLKQVPPAVGHAITDACQRLLAMGDAELMTHFPIDVFQTGSGTSSNMNANEVVATLAGAALGEAVSPNDHVNAGQSSNDVIPTALHVSAALQLHQQLLPALDHLVHVTRHKASSVHRFVKTGRTHLMDAMPVRMSQVLEGWAHQLEAAGQHLRALMPALQGLAQGGTAVGTGVNAHPQFAHSFALELSALTQLEFKTADNFFAAMGSQDTAVAVSGQLKALAVSLMKIANDLRWMNSGPLAGLGEIELEALQPGSSIMPGKVNPVIPEMCRQVAAQVMGNDVAVSIGGALGDFELNVMVPVIAKNLLESIAILSRACRLLAERCVDGIVADTAKLARDAEMNLQIGAALNTVIGYDRAGKIVKQAAATGRSIREVAEEQGVLSPEELARVLDPLRLTKGGVI